jgi:hypothetical protein
MARRLMRCGFRRSSRRSSSIFDFDLVDWSIAGPRNHRKCRLSAGMILANGGPLSCQRKSQPTCDRFRAAWHPRHPKCRGSGRPRLLD